MTVVYTRISYELWRASHYANTRSLTAAAPVTGSDAAAAGDDVRGRRPMASLRAYRGWSTRQSHSAKFNHVTPNVNAAAAATAATVACSMNSNGTRIYQHTSNRVKVGL